MEQSLLKICMAWLLPRSRSRMWTRGARQISGRLPVTDRMAYRMLRVNRPGPFSLRALWRNPSLRRSMTSLKRPSSFWSEDWASVDVQMRRAVSKREASTVISGSSANQISTDSSTHNRGPRLPWTNTRSVTFKMWWMTLKTQGLRSISLSRSWRRMAKISRSDP